MRLYRKDGKDNVALTKSETQRILEGTYIAQQISRNIPDCKESELFVAHGRELAKLFGAQHLDEQGELKEPESRKATP